MAWVYMLRNASSASVALLVGVQVAEQSVGGEVRYRRDRRVLGDERPGEGGAEVDGGHDVVGLGVHVANGLSQPALVADPGRLGGVPDVHRAEVGAAGHGVADAMEYGDLAVVEQVLDRAHGRVEAVLVVQRNYVFLLYADVGPVVYVLRIGVRDNAVEIVVAARKLDYDELAVLSCTHLDSLLVWYLHTGLFATWYRVDSGLLAVADYAFS